MKYSGKVCFFLWSPFFDITFIWELDRVSTKLFEAAVFHFFLSKSCLVCLFKLRDSCTVLILRRVRTGPYDKTAHIKRLSTVLSIAYMYIYLGY